MALELRLDIKTSDNCENLVIRDITGNYEESQNPGGWGGVNITPNNLDFISYLRCFLPLKVNSIGEEVTVLISIPVASEGAQEVFQQTNSINPIDHPNSFLYPTANSIEGFVLSISYEDYYAKIDQEIIASNSNPANLGLTAEQYDYVIANMGAWTSFEDHVYSFEISSINSSFVTTDLGVFEFSTSCNIRKSVTDILTSADIRCEDCDDSDLSKILLAKNLLETLDSI